MSENTGGPARASAGLGTFAGVFTPSILTILGIILFLRLGFVVGSAGLGRALVMILLANSISVLTSISLSAIATNLRVKGGGDYYLISRTLGVEFGGALGLVLFLAQSVSIAFYVIGFGEALATILGRTEGWFVQAVAAIAVALLFVLAWLGSDWATRFQYVVMAVLAAALITFFVGGIGAWSPSVLRGNLAAAPVFDETTREATTLGFWAIFAIFFPAVTGFTQGVSMSGDLKDPGKSLPVGTFAAVGLSLVVYLGCAVLFAGAVSGRVLVDDYGAMRQVSIVPVLIDAGVIAATLSSALASFLGAPRILQSLARDQVFSFLRPFAVGHGPMDNPRRGVLLSTGIAFATIALGELNLIASVVTMFFLISYGLLNYATYVEAKANSPSFRPRFRFFHARLSLAGALGCLGAMLAIEPTAGAAAAAVMFAVHRYIGHTGGIDRWADSGRSQRFQRLRRDLHGISDEPEHPRYWRPVLLAFSDSEERRERILRFASWLEGNSGLTTVVRVLEGEGPGVRRVQQQAEAELRAEIRKHELPAFPRVVVAPDIEDAIPVLLQSYGLGPVRANTLLLNWFDRESAEPSPALRGFDGRYLRLAPRFACNLILLAAGSKDFEAITQTRRDKRTIDVWHRDNATGRLMLLLAYLMTRTDQWEDARIRLFAPPAADRSPEETLAELRTMLDDVRIDATPTIVDEASPESVLRHSTGSSMVFLPMRLGDDGPTTVYGTPLDPLVAGLGITAIALAAQDIHLDAEPEAGRLAEVAEAVDAAKKTAKTAAEMETAATETATAAAAARTALEEARAASAPEEQLAELESGAEAAEQEAERARRRAARAQAKADSARAEADALTGSATSDTPEAPKPSPPVVDPDGTA